MAGRRAGPKNIKAGKVALSLPCYNTRESRPCNSPGWYSRAGPRFGKCREVVPRMIVWKSWPCLLSALWWHLEGEIPFPDRVVRAGKLAMTLTSCNTQENRPYISPGQPR